MSENPEKKSLAMADVEALMAKFEAKVLDAVRTMIADQGKAFDSKMGELKIAMTPSKEAHVPEGKGEVGKLQPPKNSFINSEGMVFGEPAAYLKEIQVAAAKNQTIHVAEDR